MVETETEHKLKQEKEALDHLATQLKTWTKSGDKGMILHMADRHREYVNWVTSEVAAKKQQLVALELEYTVRRQVIEKDIVAFEYNQSQRKTQYDLCMDALGQVRKYAPPPVKVEEVKPVVKKTAPKKKKIIQVEVDEDDVRDVSPSSPPAG